MILTIVKGSELLETSVMWNDHMDIHEFVKMHHQESCEGSGA